MPKIVLITGASRGIGREFAELYAAEGSTLLLVARTSTDLRTVKKELEERYKVKVVAFAMDLAKPGAAKALHAKLAKVNVDVLINNAGIGKYGESVEMDVIEVERMLQLNVATLTELCVLFGKDFKQRKTGAILNVASTAAFFPLPYLGAYAASKAYIVSFSEALAKELEDFGVTVTCVCPGTTRTDFFKVAGRPELGEDKGLMSAQEVARIGKRALEEKKLTVLMSKEGKRWAFRARLLPRRWVAAGAKRMMKAWLG